MIDRSKEVAKLLRRIEQLESVKPDNKYCQRYKDIVYEIDLIRQTIKMLKNDQYGKFGGN